MVMETGKKLQPKHLSNHAKMGAMVDAIQMKTFVGYIEKASPKVPSSVWAVCRSMPKVAVSISNLPCLKTSKPNDDCAEEIFGPVLSAITFDTEDEALRIANDSPYVWQRLSDH